MTVCIGAICEDPAATVVASDRMVTVSSLIEFEHDIPKLEAVGEQCIALTAGNALAHTELFRSVKTELTQYTEPSVSQINKVVAEQYAERRRQAAEAKVLKPRGVSLSEFYSRFVREWPEALAIAADSAIQQADYELSIVIAGVDNEGAHVYGISDPGTISCYDSIGYYAIGTGGIHATLRLIAKNVTPAMDLNETVYAVYEAKRSAEVAPGVGKATDMAIINARGIEYLNEQTLESLSAIYEKQFVPVSEEVDRMVSDLDLQGGAE